MVGVSFVTVKLVMKLRGVRWGRNPRPEPVTWPDLVMGDKAVLANVRSLVLSGDARPDGVLATERAPEKGVALRVVELAT